MSGSEERRQAAIRRALELIIEALDLIDAHDGPAQAAANIDLGRQQLQAALAKAAG